MSSDPKYREMITACNNLVQNSQLSLYEEVEMLRSEAQKSRNNFGLLKKLNCDLSFLIDRLSSAEKLTYLRCCENVKAISNWESTEP
jgi:hypothetical protein